MKTSKHFPAVLAISLPVIFILVMLCAVYLPTVFFRVPYSFVYDLNKTTYGPPAGFQPGQVASKTTVTTEHYIYDKASKTSRKIGDQEYSSLAFIPATQVETQVTNETHYNGDIFTDFFGGSNYVGPSIYAEKGNIKKKIFNIPSDENFTFIGWLK